VDRQSRDRPVPGFSSLVGGSVLIDHEVEGGDLIDPDGTATCELQVFHTPGHSAGSISLFCAAEGALFTGDAVPVEGDLPVYDDALASVHSVQTLRSIRDFHHLLSSWDIPRRGERAYFQMERALAYLQKIHEVILHISSEGKTDSMDVANEAAAALGLPPQAVSPLLARTLEANLCVRNTRNLIR
jgi:glyoxylase-like metal-dependent hydrolase (beta-lactamase superfamily II)